MQIGSQNRGIYDNCTYQKRLYESMSPLDYNLYQGAYENCNKCRFNEFWTPYELVNVESELKNLTRPLSQCDQFKYGKECTKSGYCVSTFNRQLPVVYPPEVCPIVYNNIPKQTSIGFDLSNPNFCMKY